MLSRRSFIAQSIGGLALAQGIARAATVGNCKYTIEASTLKVTASGGQVGFRLSSGGIPLLTAMTPPTYINKQVAFLDTITVRALTMLKIFSITEKDHKLELWPFAEGSEALTSPIKIPLVTSSPRFTVVSRSNVTLFSAMLGLTYTAPTTPGDTMSTLVIRFYQ